LPKIVDRLEASEAPAALKQFGCTIERWFDAIVA